MQRVNPLVFCQYVFGSTKLTDKGCLSASDGNLLYQICLQLVFHFVAHASRHDEKRMIVLLRGGRSKVMRAAMTNHKCLAKIFLISSTSMT